jgi:hypothetical protein
VSALLTDAGARCRDPLGWQVCGPCSGDRQRENTGIPGSPDQLTSRGEADRKRTSSICALRKVCPVLSSITHGRMLYIAHLKHVSAGRHETAIEDCCPRSKHERHPVPDGILVLCPNAALSSQVRMMLSAMQITVSRYTDAVLASMHRRLPRVKHAQSACKESEIPEHTILPA